MCEDLLTACNSLPTSCILVQFARACVCVFPLALISKLSCCGWLYGDGIRCACDLPCIDFSDRLYILYAFLYLCIACVEERGVDQLMLVMFVSLRSFCSRWCWWSCSVCCSLCIGCQGVTWMSSCQWPRAIRGAIWKTSVKRPRCTRWEVSGDRPPASVLHW